MAMPDNNLKEKIIAQLQTVDDPELQLDIYSLGLIYDIKIKANQEVEIVMTLTTPACPYGPMIVQMVEMALRQINIDQPKITVVFEPAWQAPQNLRELLGL